MSEKKLKDLKCFKIYEDPNEIDLDEEGDEDEDAMNAILDSSIKHPKYALSTLDYMLEKKDSNCYRCRLSRKVWSSGKGIPLESDLGDPEYIELPTPTACGRAFDGDIVAVQLKELYDEVNSEGKDPSCLGKGCVVGILERNFSNIYEERFICRADDYNPRLMVPLNGTPFKFSIVSPWHRFPPKGKVFQYFRKPNKNGEVEIEAPKELLLEKRGTENGVLGTQLFSVRYMNWSKYYIYPRGYVDSSFDALNIKRYSVQFQIHGKHNKKSIETAEKITGTVVPTLCEEAEREDLTDLYVFTIDDEKSWCLDDALSIESCEMHPNCWKVGVHITDVGSIVDEKSKLNEVAKERLISAEDLTYEEEKDYDKTDGKLFPHVLTEKCSLTSVSEERLAVSTFFHSQDPPLCIYTDKPKQYDYASHSPVLSVVIPKQKLTYEEAQELINKRKKEKFRLASQENLAQQLYHLWQVMWQFRLNRLHDAAYFIRNLGFSVGDISPSECMARILVEEAMITNNAFTARYLKHKNIPFLARCQPHPNLAKMNLVRLLELSPYQESFHHFYKGREPDYDGELQKKMHNPNTMIVSRNVWQKIHETLSNESMEVAVFLACCDRLHPELGASYSQFSSVEEKHQIKLCDATQTALPHFLLRLDLYTKCTSPLRSYIDLDTQRRLVRCLNGEDQPKIDEDIGAKYCDREEVLKKFNHCQIIHNASEKIVCTEGFVVELNEFQIQVFFPNFSIVGNLGKLPIFLNLLGPTKRMGDSKLEWTLRFYDLETQNRVDRPQRVKVTNSTVSTYFEERSVVSTNCWKKFVDCLKSDSLSENNEHKRLIKRVYETLSEEQKGKHEIVGCLRTCNGVFHGRNISVQVSAEDKVLKKENKTLGTSLYFQFGWGVENGIEAVLPHFLFLNRDESQDVAGLEVCMVHRRHVTVFDVECDDITLKSKDFKNLKKKKSLMYHYYKKWLPLVMMDGIYASVHDCDSITIQLDQITFDGWRGLFTLGRLFCENCFLELQRGDFLCFRKRNKTRGDLIVSMAHGVIIKAISGEKKSHNANEAISDEKKSHNVYHFRVFPIRGSSPFQLKSNEVLSCEIIPLSISHRRMVKALSSLTKASPLVQTICVGIKQEISDKTPNPSRPPSRVSNAIKEILRNEHQRTLANFPHILNKKQLDQIERALGNPFTLIQGPPGTGKSYMGAHLAYYFSQLNRRLLKQGKILYCGPSNKSVDVVAEYLKYVPNLKFIRVYGGVIEESDFPIPLKPQFGDREKIGRVPDSLKSRALHHVIRQRGRTYAGQIELYDKKFLGQAAAVTLSNYKDYKNLVEKAKMEILKQTDVILCTCSVAGGKLLSDLSKSSEFQFTQCIVDECGMCSEPETLIPIVTATAKCPNPQIVLIGDHKQLEPVITCRAAAKGGLKKSLFERLQVHAVKLTVQYRMHETICEYPSKTFYDDELETDKSVRLRNRGVLEQINDGKNPVLFCNVNGLEEEDESKSKFNVDQVKVTMKFLKYLLGKIVPPQSVMVLSPYLAQCKKLKEAVAKLASTTPYRNRINLDSIHVGSVVTSQGSESDYVVLSTVRSSDCTDSMLSVNPMWLNKKIGFVTDDHQINVAITRARLGLVIIGNKQLLEHHHTWRGLIRSYERRNAILQEEDLS